MQNFLYTIIIYPLKQIIEFVYRVFFEVCGNQGISVIGVSIAVTLLCLPLYAVAENWQEQERKIQEKLSSGIKRIKKSFSGDEQYMILSTFYKQNHYHPLMALRSSFSLLIQVPFFIAAYSFLSNCSDLQGNSFLFIRDMGTPDALFSIGSFSVNILPIAMTIINCIAGAIYSKGHPFREKAQIYGMALIFLVILYQSPAGLVLYWTMNNIFSLVKNIFYKLKNPIKAFYFMMAGVSVIALLFVIIKTHCKLNRVIPVGFLTFIIIVIPFIIKAVSFAITNVFSELVNDSKKRNSLFITSSICFAVLSGIIIPSLLITSSTAGDFCYIDGYTTPLYFLYNSALQCLGLFVFWPFCVYFLFGKRVQTGIAAVFFIGLILCIINAFGFQGNYGIVSPEIVFTEHKTFKPSVAMFCVNSVILILTIGILFIFFEKKWNLIWKSISSVILIAFIGISVINCIKIQADFRNVAKPEQKIDSLDPIVHLSKTGTNVIVFMLDRAAGYLIDDAFEECPELFNQFTGFTFYPNTISFGSWTIQGAPGLYGGYEYTPWSMNHRRELTMQEKHNQALSVMPFVFEKNGYTCDLIDPPYPNYDTAPIFSFLDGHNKVTPYETIGRYSDLWYKLNDYTPLPIKSTLIKRNFIWFSIFKMVPPILRSAVHYNDWWSADNALESNSDFINRYATLDFLPELTDTDAEGSRFVLVDNESTHDTGFVQAPDFVPVETQIDFSKVKNDLYRNDRGYHGLVASLKRIGEWFDYLKQNGVYDNTKIIIIADHGSNQRSPLFKSEGNLPRNLEWFNPMLMVKDFNAKGMLRKDNSFMTQADVPAVAFENVIQNAVNPFTGNEIKILTAEQKKEKSIVSFSQANAVRTSVNNGFRINDSDWYSVSDTIFDIRNWKQCNVADGEFVK